MPTMMTVSIFKTNIKTPQNTTGFVLTTNKTHRHTTTNTNTQKANIDTNTVANNPPTWHHLLCTQSCSGSAITQQTSI